MKIYSKKSGGFTLIEVVISMLLIAILSIGVYNAYLIIIRTTKDGEVKQSAALCGKKILEFIKGEDDFTKSGDDNHIVLQLDNKNVILNYDINSKDWDTITDLKLDKEFKICSDQSDANKDYVYTQSISISLTKGIDADGKKININKNNNPENDINTNILKHEFSLERNESNYSITDINNNTTSSLENVSGIVSIYLYLESDNLEKKITIKDSSGNVLLGGPIDLGELSNEENKKNEVRLSINFKKYSGNNLKDVRIYVYNKNEEKNCTTNIYLEKAQNLTVDVKVNEGEAYIYNNRAEDPNYKIGDLYDIKTEIKNKDNETLFTGYSNQNININ